MKRPAGRSLNANRPSASVSAIFMPISCAVTRTCARRTGAPVSAATTRPAIRPVPVLTWPRPPNPGIIMGSPAVCALSMKTC
jgi:hypothetical protein